MYIQRRRQYNSTAKNIQTHDLNIMSHYRFMNNKTPTLISKRLTIVQVELNTLDVVNNLMNSSEGTVYNINITQTTLNNVKYFVAYVGKIPVAVTGFKMVRWGYHKRRLTNTSSVTHVAWRRQDYMIEMKRRIYTFMESVNVYEVHTIIDEGSETMVKTAEELNFKQYGTYRGTKLMRLKFKRWVYKPKRQRYQ